jgi:unsaturated rhamnogalacturonyl hydrolase
VRNLRPLGASCSLLMPTPRCAKSALIRNTLLAIGFGTVALLKAAAQSTPVDLGPWPAGASPQEVGLLVAQRFVASPHPGFNRGGRMSPIIYPETCAWYGALTFAQLTGNKDLTAALIKRFDPLFGAEAARIPKPVNVDSTVFGVVPFELYIQTKDPRYLQIGQDLADRQWGPPPDTILPPGAAAPVKFQLSPEGQDGLSHGLTWQTRYWVDDMYMITMVETQAYRATGDPKYIDRAAREVAAYLDKLQEPNGLFHHAPDVPFFWGRGDGWFAVGMAELLRSLPADNPQRARIMQGYQTMMASLLRYQDANGMWHQLIDHPEAWPETSCTGMFAFAMITGVKNGWLDAATYAPAARKAWLGLVAYINLYGDVRDVCEGTNKKNDYQYYLDRGKKVGDMHGQAPILWCASALLR